MRYKIIYFNRIPLKIYENGQIFNCSTGSELTHKILNDEPVVYINQQSTKVSHLLATCFIPKLSSKQRYVLHLDGNKSNNALSNLRWSANTRQTRDHFSGIPVVIENQHAGKKIKFNSISDASKYIAAAENCNHKDIYKILASKNQYNDWILKREEK